MDIIRKNSKENYDYFLFVLKAANICVFEVDIINQLYLSFMNAEDIFHVSGESILKDVQPFSQLSPEDYQKACSDYFSHPDDHEVINQAFQHIFKGESTSYQARMKAGHKTDFMWCQIDVTPIIENGIPSRMIGVITNINHMIDKVKKLESESHHDSFTQLYNKNYTLSLIQETIHTYPFQKHALLLLDIDNFKSINDTYGHAWGDQIILLVAKQLKDNLRKDDIIGRFGGDEFIVLLKNIQDIELLYTKISQLVEYHDEIYHYSNSIGVAVYPDDTQNITELFELADQALYHSKLTKKTYTIYKDMKK